MKIAENRRNHADGFSFFLGTHETSWLARAGIPLFVSERRLSKRSSLPRAMAPWALDSGGFSELSLFGEWRTTPKVYARHVERYRDEVGMLQFAAIQDYMCEPFMLTRTGLDVATHQARTIDSLETLQTLLPDMAWLPVLQGYLSDDYMRHLDMYAARGHDLATYPLVGIGSVCRRQSTVEAETIIRRISGRGIRLHAFGYKRMGIPKVKDVIGSADSMAWSLDARRLGYRWCEYGEHANCANCLDYALHWRAETMRGIQS